MSLRALPEPDGGWRGVGAQAVTVAVLWALATFTIVAFLVPRMDPECHTDGTGTTICPLPESRNPALTGILDVRWTSAGGWEALALGFSLLAILVAVGVSLFLSTTTPWSSQGGAPDTVGVQAALVGVGLGLVVAGPGYLRPIIALGLVAAGLLAWLLAGLLCRSFVRSLRRRHAEHLRRAQLREQGRRTLADVVEVRWLQSAGTSDRFVFEVTARPRGATQTVVSLLGVPRADAPVVGGTVFSYTDDAHDHPTGIAVVIDADPDSIRDPGAEQRYPDLPAD